MVITMPINIPNNLPAFTVLNNENIFVKTDVAAVQQDIRPLKIAILNLMPKKIETETQILIPQQIFSAILIQLI